MHTPSLAFKSPRRSAEAPNYAAKGSALGGGIFSSGRLFGIEQGKPGLATASHS
jgi:hypothetical protein